MAKPITPPRDAAADDDDDSRSQSSWSESGISNAYSSHPDEDSTLGGSMSSGTCSLDSIGRMLIQLEDNDSSLKELLIDCTSMDADAANFFSQFLPNNTHLQKLRLHCGHRSRHRQILGKVLLGLKDNSSVSFVEIQGAEIDCEVASWLVPSFANSQKLQHISMMDCDFVGSGVGILFVALQHNKGIRHLRFHSCDWEDHNVDIISSSLPFLNLHSLSLVDINIDVGSWPYLFQSMEHCTDLIFLDLSQNDFDVSNIDLLIQGLTAQKSISKLSLTSCGLNDKCTKALAKGLRRYSTLTSLDISQNKHMSDKGVVYLKDLMKFNNSITELKVDDCGLSTQSVNAVENGLRYNDSFLKSFFSETTSQAIFGVIDSIEQIDIAGAVSFDSESSPRKKEEMNINPKNSRRLRHTQPSPRKLNPIPTSPKNGNMSQRQSSVRNTEGKGTRTTTDGKRRMLM